MIITPIKTYNLHDEYDRDIFERELKRGNEFLEYQKDLIPRPAFVCESGKLSWICAALWL